MSDDIPPAILVDIVRSAGHQGFRNLGPYIAMGKAGRAAAYNTLVLNEVNLQEYLNESSMANLGTKYRVFFEKCLEHGNKSAIYLEGIRVGAKSGPCEEAISMLRSVAEDLPQAQFAEAIFMMCEGQYVAGMEVMRMFYRRMIYVENAVAIANNTYQQIVSLGPCFPGKYSGTYTFDDFPACIFCGCRMFDPCFECFAYWYVFAFMALC